MGWHVGDSGTDLLLLEFRFLLELFDLLLLPLQLEEFLLFLQQTFSHLALVNLRGGRRFLFWRWSTFSLDNSNKIESSGHSHVKLRHFTFGMKAGFT